MERVDESDFPYCAPSDVQYGMVTNYEGVRNWLVVTDVNRFAFCGAIRGGCTILAFF